MCPDALIDEKFDAHVTPSHDGLGFGGLHYGGEPAPPQPLGVGARAPRVRSRAAPPRRHRSAAARRAHGRLRCAASPSRDPRRPPARRPPPRRRALALTRRRAAPPRAANPSKTFLGGLNYDTTEEGLRQYFESKYGHVADAHVVRERDTQRSRGFGFVTFSSSNEAQAAIQALDGTDHDGRQLRVNVSEPRQN